MQNWVLKIGKKRANLIVLFTREGKMVKILFLPGILKLNNSD